MHAHRNSVPHPAYRAMLAISREAKWPEAFATDLTKHDREALATVPHDARLFWVLRRCGTFLCLVTKRPLDGAGHHVWDAPRWFPRTFGEGNYRYFTWDGAQLIEHDVHADLMSDMLRHMAHDDATPQGVAFERRTVDFADGAVGT